MAVDIPVVIDVEASGFGAGSYPIEIGFVLGSGASFCTLVTPLPEWDHWDAEAAAVHGIDRDMLQVRGKPARDVAFWLNEHLAGQVVFSDGWAQDNTWISRLFDEVGVLMRFRIQTIRYLMDEKQLQFWQQARGQAASQVSGRHRASADARMIQQAYLLSRDMARRGFVAPQSPSSVPLSPGKS
jgi:hypothetical protein